MKRQDFVRNQIEDILLARLDMGAVTKGPWKIPYERMHTKESIGEVIDLAIYASRLLVQWDEVISILDEVAHIASARIALNPEMTEEEAISLELNDNKQLPKLIKAMARAIRDESDYGNGNE